MLESILIVGAVMLFCAILLSPFYLFKKKDVLPANKTNEQEKLSAIEAVLCSIPLISLLVYFAFSSEGLYIPPVISFVLFAAVGYAVYYASGKKLVWKIFIMKLNL